MSTPRPRRAARRWAADRSIGLKLAVVVVVLSFVAIATAAVSLRGTHALEMAGEQMQRRHVQPLVALGAIQNSFQSDRVSVVTREATDETSMVRVRREFAEREATIEELVASYQGAEADEESWAQAITALDAYYASAHRQLAAGSPTPADLSEERRLAAGVLAPLSVEYDAQARAAAALATEGQQLADQVTAAVVIALLVGLALSGVLAQAVLRPLTRGLRAVRDVTSAVEAGDLTRLTAVESGDEIGRSAASLDASILSLRSVVGSMVDSAAAVAAGAGDLEDSATSISSAALQTSEQSSAAAGAAREVSRHVASVATGAEQMRAAIREIAQSANDAVRVASQAMGVAGLAGERIEALGSSSQEIGAVVKVITAIAEQTNLLALNATIEAARAGDAGKGFAVVAGEVKELARETARATEEIAARVSAIQADTGGAVGAISEISSIIARVNDLQLSIASAVEEQTATTGEMSRSVGEAATGSERIAAIIDSVASAAEETTVALAQTRAVIGALNDQAATLGGQVAGFRR